MRRATVAIAIGLFATLAIAQTKAPRKVQKNAREIAQASSPLRNWIAVTHVAEKVVFVVRGNDKVAATALGAKRQEDGRWLVPFRDGEVALDVVTVLRASPIAATEFDGDFVVVRAKVCKFIRAAYSEDCQTDGTHSSIVEHYDDYQCVDSRQEDVCKAYLMGNNGRILFFNNPNCAGTPARKIPTSEAEGVRCPKP